MSRRLVGLGVLAFLFGVATVVDSGLAGILPLSGGVATVIGVAATGVGGYMLWKHRPETLSTEHEAPEMPVDRPAIGAEFTRDLESLSGIGPEAMRRRRTVRDELEQTAQGILTTYAGVPDEQATAALQQGTWTDNPHAAAYFSGAYPEWAPLSLRIRDSTPLQPDETRKLKAVIDELESLIDEQA